MRKLEDRTNRFLHFEFARGGCFRKLGVDKLRGLYRDLTIYTQTSVRMFEGWSMDLLQGML